MVHLLSISLLSIYVDIFRWRLLCFPKINLAISSFKKRNIHYLSIMCTFFFGSCTVFIYAYSFPVSQNESTYQACGIQDFGGDFQGPHSWPVQKGTCLSILQYPEPHWLSIVYLSIDLIFRIYQSIYASTHWSIYL